MQTLEEAMRIPGVQVTLHLATASDNRVTLCFKTADSTRTFKVEGNAATLVLSLGTPGSGIPLPLALST